MHTDRRRYVSASVEDEILAVGHFDIEGWSLIIKEDFFEIGCDCVRRQECKSIRNPTLLAKVVESVRLSG